MCALLILHIFFYHNYAKKVKFPPKIRNRHTQIACSIPWNAMQVSFLWHFMPRHEISALFEISSQISSESINSRHTTLMGETLARDQCSQNTCILNLCSISSKNWWNFQKAKQSMKLLLLPSEHLEKYTEHTLSPTVIFKALGLGSIENLSKDMDPLCRKLHNCTERKWTFIPCPGSPHPFHLTTMSPDT